MTTSDVSRGGWTAALLLLIFAVLGLPLAAAAVGVCATAAALMLLAMSAPSDAQKLPAEGRVASLLARARSAARSVQSAAAAPFRDRRDERPHTARVRRAALAVAILPGLYALCVGVVGVDTLDDDHLWPWQGVAGVLGTASAIIFLSSLVDWSYVTPAMRGERGQHTLPCRTSTAPRWRKVTRRWLAHRIAAYLVVRFAVVAVISLIVAAIVVATDPKIGQPEGAVIGAVLGTGGAAIVVFFLNRFVPVMTLVSNPPLHVGDQVTLAEEYGAGVHQRPVYYVVDIAIEGVQLLELGPDGRPLGRHPRTHDRSLALADVPRLLRFRERFRGCDVRCCKANRYCPLELDDVLAPPPIETTHE